MGNVQDWSRGTRTHPASIWHLVAQEGGLHCWVLVICEEEKSRAILKSIVDNIFARCNAAY